MLTRNKTLIVIAHRLSTIQHADQIIVLGNQQILEKGSHQLLLKLEAHYKICGICICIQKTEVSIPKVIKLMSKRRLNMFRITFKILNWVSPYKTRMILGFIMSFLNAIFIALPIFGFTNI